MCGAAFEDILEIVIDEKHSDPGSRRYYLRKAHCRYALGLILVNNRFPDAIQAADFDL